MLVAVFQAAAPHHDAVVEQRAVAFTKTGHLFYHVGILVDVELRDGGDFADLLGLVVVMGGAVVRVAEAEFRIRDTIRRGADVGADACRVCLEGEHGEVAHDLHVFAALVALGDFHLDGRRIAGLALAGGHSGFLQRRFLLPILDGGDATLDRAHAVEVFIELLLVAVRQFLAQVSRAADDEIEHLAVERVCGRRLAFLARFAKETIQNAARIDLRRHRLRGRAEAAMRVIAFVEPFLVLLVRLRHRRQLQRG